MNIELHTRKKMNDILTAKPEAINENFDRMSKDLLDMANALGDYQIDLSSDDVTGQLGVDNIDTDALAEDLGLDALAFTARTDDRRWCHRQTTTATKLEVGISAATDSNDGGATPSTDTTWNTYTPTTTGAKGGFDMPTFTRSSHLPHFRLYMKTGSVVSNLRMWFGLMSAGATNVDTHAAHCIAFRYSTVVPDTSWVGVCRDGTTQSATSAIGSFAADTVYRLSFEVASMTSVTFTVEDITNGTAPATATITANLPLNTQNLLGSCQLFTTENVAKSWLFSRVYIESN